MKTLRHAFVSLIVLCSSVAWGQGNGNLQLHYMAVGQGDGALLITPKGKTVLFDCGLKGGEKVLAYLDQLGITKIDYLVTSHYHADHCGGVAQIFGSNIELGAAYDRGQPRKTSATFIAYDLALHAKRRTATPGTSLTLDDPASSPVVIEFVATNGNGVSTDDENDQSIVAVVRFGKFDAEFGGDLSGYEHKTYHDVETSVAPKVGQVEVYKVHHHGSAHSTNQVWLSTLLPKVGIISCGNGNAYGHPTQETMDTLHDANVVTYWTARGAGADPMAGKDHVVGDIVIQVPVRGETFTVGYGDNQLHSYTSWGVTGGTPAPGTPALEPQTYVWSKNSKIYHFPECAYCASISTANRQSGTAPPAPLTLHKDCPR